MSMKSLRIFAALSSLAWLAACSGNILPEPKKIEYKSAGKLPSLEVPPDLTQPARDDRYAVPDLAPKGSATYSAYAGERKAGAKTAATPVLPESGKIRIERAGSQRWLVAPGTPEELWPKLKEFWQELGFIIDVELPEAGVMETDWAENRAKIPQDIIPVDARQGVRQPVFDAGARQVPHAHRERRRTGHGRDLHQPPRHV
jgi:outer membrane protein assembly factor BamC